MCWILKSTIQTLYDKRSIPTPHAVMWPLAGLMGQDPDAGLTS